MDKRLDDFWLIFQIKGDQFIFLFSEVKYYLSGNEVEVRNGFKFEF